MYIFPNLSFPATVLLEKLKALLNEYEQQQPKRPQNDWMSRKAVEESNWEAVRDNLLHTYVECQVPKPGLCELCETHQGSVM